MTGSMPNAPSDPPGKPSPNSLSATVMVGEAASTILLGAGLLMLGVVLLLRPIADPDIWFHLVVGREVFQRGEIPAR